MRTFFLFSLLYCRNLYLFIPFLLQSSQLTSPLLQEFALTRDLLRRLCPREAAFFKDLTAQHASSGTGRTLGDYALCARKGVDAPCRRRGVPCATRGDGVASELAGGAGRPVDSPGHRQVGGAVSGGAHREKCAATALRMRLRLGGDSFPPRIFFKLYFTSPSHDTSNTNSSGKETTQGKQGHPQGHLCNAHNPKITQRPSSAAATLSSNARPRNTRRGAGG